jgi:hypothetical protein
MKLVTGPSGSKYMKSKTVKMTRTLYSPKSEYSLGAEVEIGFWGGETVTGQVWALATKGLVHVATGSTWYAVEVKSGKVYSSAQSWAGQVGLVLSSMEAIEEVLAA